MGLGGISIWQLLIILVIILLIFGPSRLKNIGSQLGTAVKDFRKTIKDNEEDPESKTEQTSQLDDKSKDATSQSVSQNDQNKS